MAMTSIWRMPVLLYCIPRANKKDLLYRVNSLVQKGALLMASCLSSSSWAADLCEIAWEEAPRL